MVKGRLSACLATDQISHVVRSRRTIYVRSVQNGSGQSHCSQFILFSSFQLFPAVDWRIAVDQFQRVEMFQVCG